MATNRFLAAALATAAVIGASTTASAADIPANAPNYRAPAVITNFDWSGFYAGVNVGYGSGKAPTTIVPNEAAFGFLVYTPENVSPNPSGFIGGGQIGYNHQIGRVVAGLEADVSYSGMRKAESATGQFSIAGQLTTTAETNLAWLGTVRGRLGYLPAHNFLIFATGGLAYGEVNTVTTGSNLICPGNNYCATGSTSGVSTGWTGGGGFEYAFSRQWTAKAEYLFVDLGNRSVTFSDPVNPGSTFTATTDFKAHIVRAGLNYRFGAPD